MEKKETIKNVEGINKVQIDHLEQFWYNKGKFKSSFLQFDGYTDLFSTIESLINVCILASRVEGDFNDPGLDIQKYWNWQINSFFINLHCYSYLYP